MKRMYLTMKAERFLGRDSLVKDRAEWVEIEKGKRWLAKFKLPQGDHLPPAWTKEVNEFRNDWFRGVIYMCEERTDEKGNVQGGRYHYAVQYDLQTENESNVISDQSDIFMASTYTGRNFARYQITPEQWLSLQAIPEKPPATE